MGGEKKAKIGEDRVWRRKVRVFETESSSFYSVYRAAGFGKSTLKHSRDHTRPPTHRCRLWTLLHQLWTFKRTGLTRTLLGVDAPPSSAKPWAGNAALGWAAETGGKRPPADRG